MFGFMVAFRSAGSVEKLAIIASSVFPGKGWASDGVSGRRRVRDGNVFPDRRDGGTTGRCLTLQRSTLLRKRFNFEALPTNLKAGFLIIHKNCG